MRLGAGGYQRLTQSIARTAAIWAAIADTNTTTIAATRRSIGWLLSRFARDATPSARSGGAVGERTGIQWTSATWNPVRGCSRVSEGCRHCYAEVVAARFSGPGLPYEGLARRVGGEARWTGKVRMVPEHLADPLRWKKPRRIFVNSMSDLFHEGLSFEQIAAVFGVMAAAGRHTFQVLTKRPQRAREFLDWIGGAGNECDLLGDHASEALIAAGIGVLEPVHHRLGSRVGWPLPNVQLGFSAEDQDTFNARWCQIAGAPAAVLFCSYEPALGPVNARGALGIGDYGPPPRRLDWIIVGGESGPGARPFNIEWVRSTIDDCREAGVACFVKQLGAKPTIADGDYRDFGFAPHVTFSGTGQGRIGCWLRDSHGGDPDEWPADLRVREFPA